MWDLPSVPTKEQLAQHSDLLTYAGVLGLSIWGGMTNYFEKKHEKPFSWSELFANLLSSSFAGVLTFLACQYAGISGPLAGVLIGVTSHMGTPALIALAMKLKAVRQLIEPEAK